MKTLEDNVKDAPKITGRDVLNKYETSGNLTLIMGGVGVALLGMSGFEHNTTGAVCGGVITLFALGRSTYNLMEAYFKARLDYLQNGRFTKLGR